MDATLYERVLLNSGSGKARIALLFYSSFDSLTDQLLQYLCVCFCFCICCSVVVCCTVSVCMFLGVSVCVCVCVFVYLDSFQIDCIHHCALKKRHCGIVTLQQSFQLQVGLFAIQFMFMFMLHHHDDRIDSILIILCKLKAISISTYINGRK